MTDHAYAPDWISHPGETILDLLEEKGLTQAEFADRAGFTKKHVNELVKGKSAITADAALRLERVLGSTADFWLNREVRYREALARQEALESHKASLGWLKELPLAEMINFGWVKAFKDKARQLEACLGFFGVNSIEAWRKTYEAPLAAYRASPKFQKKPGSVAAWLRRAELEASSIRCRPYDKGKFRETLHNLRALTNEPEPDLFIPKLVEASAQCGVAIVFLRTPNGCPTSGATRWLTPDKAMLVLSLRHKTNDHLWFTFFHEAGHILLHGKKLVFVDIDGLDGEQEEEANHFSRDLLIPPVEARELATIRGSYVAVEEYAKRIGIAPGIVVGRMQKENILPWSHLNDLKTKYEWA